MAKILRELGLNLILGDNQVSRLLRECREKHWEVGAVTSELIA
jgi:hypothetical protein